MAGKAELRRQARRRRLRLPLLERRAASSQVAARLMRVSGYLGAERVAVYLSIENEVDTRKIIEDLWDRRRECYAPVITGNQRAPMMFARHLPDGDIGTNRYGIVEPRVPQSQWRGAAELDIVLTPLVAFDRDGARLGMGGGYYDRALACRNHAPAYTRPKVIGLAFAWQEFEQLPTNRTDVYMDFVVTENEIIEV